MITRRLSSFAWALLALFLTLSQTSSAVAADGSYDWKKWEQFWSFRPVQAIVPPAAGNGEAHHPIDAFILTKLAEQKLSPAPPADRLTLLRRVTFDLIGLPPTPEEMRGFLADKAPNAYENLIDRLLASPHYGERWGRRWLDVARYVPGRISFPGVHNTAGDSHYRDYVVRAFNTDKPYARFVTEQLAGDLLPVPADRQAYLDQLIAPAFLSIGAWFDQETDPHRLQLEMIDEMVNTTSKAFLGLSVACARCHDHKFDPIPTQDYYALGGIFRSTRIVTNLTENWRDGRQRQLRPLAMPADVAANDRVRSRTSALKDERWNLLETRFTTQMQLWHGQEAAYRQAAATIARPFTLTIEAENFDGQENLRITQLSRDGKAVEVIETQTPTVQWVKYKFEVPETGNYRLEALYSTDEQTPLLVTANGDTVAESALAVPTGGFDLRYQRWATVATMPLRIGLNFIRLNAKEGSFPRIDRLRLTRVEAATQERIVSAADNQKLNAELLERFVDWPGEPWPTISGIEHFLSGEDRKRVADLTARIEQANHEIKPYPLAIAVTDQPAPADLPIHLRGQTYRTSESAVPRGVPRLLQATLENPPIPPNVSGRLELAHWLTDSRHPLTARVMVNRIWGWHFGRGIVETSSDFGSRGSPPSHPELLDWLAGEFVQKGWSIKQMHRLIMTSNTYRQAGGESSGIDPDDRLLSHFPTRRLDAEALYDAMLSTTNALVRQPAGPLEFSKSSNRAMYTLTTGRSPKGLGNDVRKMLTLFDCEMSGQPLGDRNSSATPAQSLFWLNSPLVKFYADAFAARLLKMDKLTDAKRVGMAYQLAFGRPPTEAMAQQMLAFVQQDQEDGDSREAAWSKMCQALYASTEFRYVN